MRILRNFIIAFVLTFLAIAVMMMIPSPQPEAIKPWEVSVMPDGNSKVLGIHLGNTNYQQAQQLLKVYGETALFVDPDNKMSVEAFFESINLGGLSAKMVLTLGLSDAELSQIEQRATSSMLQPSGSRKHELVQTDKESILTAPVISMTYIPSVTLSEEMLLKRFGEPSSKDETTDEEGGVITNWYYPAINMQAKLTAKHKTVLLFSLAN